MRVRPHAKGHRLLPRVLHDRGYYALTVPKDEYYVLTKASTFYPNYKLHPNTGTPLYNLKHEFSDLVSKAHDLLDGLSDDDHPQYSLANGTRAFTGVIGGVSPTAAAHLTTKEYVDVAVSGLKIDFFYTDTDSDITNYYVMQDSQTGEAESDITSAALNAGDNQLIFSFASAASLPFNNLQVGIYDGHFHLEKIAGAAKTITIYWKLFHRDTGGTETELFQSETSGAVTSAAPFELHAVLATARAFISTDRLVVKVYANVSGGGATAQVKLYVEGTTNSHMRAALETETLSDIFLRQDGTKALAGAWSMGNQILTNVNIDTGDINTAVTNSDWDAAYSHVSADGSSHADVASNTTHRGLVTGNPHVVTLAEVGGESPLTFSTGLSRSVNTITTNDGEIDHDALANVHQDVNTTASPEFVAVSTGLISSAGTISFKPSGDNDDFLTLSTSSNEVYLSTSGACNLYINPSSSLLLSPTGDVSSTRPTKVLNGQTLWINSAGNDKYMQISHNDSTAGIISVSSGDLKLSPAGNIDADTNTIENVVDPTATQHAATKAYADTKSMMTTGTYTGNDANNRQITGFGFTPKAVWIFALYLNSWLGYICSDSMGAWNSFRTETSTGTQVNYVTLIADGFEVNNNAANDFLNDLNVTYHYIAWG